MIHQKLFGAVMAATVVGVVALGALPVMAADATAPTSQASAKPDFDPVEAQITRLHDKLKITEAQNDAFNAVAQVMRDNRNSHLDLVKEKRQSEDKMTAVEDLQAYSQIAQNHADGVKKLATAFETFYGTLSDDQKKTADTLFHKDKERSMGHHMHHGMKAPK